MVDPGDRLLAGLHLDHADAAGDRAGMHAEIAADALGIDHLVAPADAVLVLADRLMRGVLAGDVTEPAFDAERLIDAGHGLVAEIEMLPVGDVRHRPGDHPAECGI